MSQKELYLPEIVSRENWLKARKELLEKEKELTRMRDQISENRRQLPMVEIGKDYVFDGPDGEVSLSDLFEGQRQLIVYHFMFDPEWDEGCKSCTFVADNIAGAVERLAAYNTEFAMVSRAPIAKIESYKKHRRWNIPWVSSFETDFNTDFQVTIDDNHTEYNYTPPGSRPEFMRSKGEWPGMSVFINNDDKVFHIYSTYARGLDQFLNTYNFLDLTPLGRQEEPHTPVGNKSFDDNCCEM